MASVCLSVCRGSSGRSGTPSSKSMLVKLVKLVKFAQRRLNPPPDLSSRRRVATRKKCS